MKTIMLSPKMPAGYGGRPMRLGKLVWEDESNKGFGIFVGYLPDGRKVGVKTDDLEKCLASIGATYKIRVSAEKVSEFNLNRLAAKFLVPTGMKQEIIKQTA